MAWDDDLLPAQKQAAQHRGEHARLLAGPGTGKTLTLTRRISYLVNECGVPPKTILALTFTRAAASELRQRIAAELGPLHSPRISTLHSFALRQLLQNASTSSALPQPLRVADDWEERHIILPDLRHYLDLPSVNIARDLLNELSADWQSLTAEDVDWETRFPNPRFLGFWREHRSVYGYTLRSELVYQLKKALEQRGDFALNPPLKHLLVDEYQDLNRCDLAIIAYLEARGIELFIAGDDDQSIYGFRKAHPDGIRRFVHGYPSAVELELEVCVRCDRRILDLGLFVAKQDHRRLEKRIHTKPDALPGRVALLRFADQDAEADGIAEICKSLMDHHTLAPNDILILLRSNRHQAFSKLIQTKLANVGVPVAEFADNPLDEREGRTFLAFLRLATNQDDSLAWRTLFAEWSDGIGDGATRALYDLAHQKGRSFAHTVHAARIEPMILPSRYRSRLQKAIGTILDTLGTLFPRGADDHYDTQGEVADAVSHAAKIVIADDAVRKNVLAALLPPATEFTATSISDLVRTVGSKDQDVEHELANDHVNILTMHRAKGLTAKAVIVAAVEDQYIPGRATGEAVDDERRLLYVSLTRAKHHLFVTYCDKRTGQQQHTGSDSGKPTRSISQFLIDSPYTPEDGAPFVRAFAQRS